jgi:hypothetical protein
VVLPDVLALSLQMCGTVVMMTVTEWFRNQQGWQREKCGACSGYGMVSSYSAFDFEGPEECNSCGGTGINWKTPKGRYVLYPGGPFC